MEPNMAELKKIEAKLPHRDGWLNVHIDGDTAIAEIV